MRSARLLRFGEMFQWRKTFGPLLRCANLHLRCAPPSFSLAAPSITLAQRQLHSRRRLLRSRRRQLHSRRSRRQQMAALNFVHFYFVK
jgi:hypothetical protein